MKILLVSDTFYPHVNGSSYFCQRLSLELHKNGHDVRVLAPSMTLKTEQTLFHGIPVYGMRSFPLLSYGYRFAPPFFLQKTVRHILKDFHPDIIHCNSHFSPNTVVLIEAKKLGIPIIASNHFIPENLMPYLPVPRIAESFERRIFWRTWAAVYRKFDAVVVPTHIAARVLLQQEPLRSVHVISNGVDTHRFHRNQNSALLLEKYHIDTSVPVFLYVGRLDAEKQVDVLIRAMEELRKKIPCRLLIGGKGSEQDRLHALAEELQVRDSVTFLGFIPDEELPALYTIASCFVIASIAELQSIATLEAMASGLPIVAANALALPELVKNDVNGYTFEPGNSQACAEACARVVAKPAKQKELGEESYKMAQEHAIQKSIHAFETLYKSFS